LVAFPEAIRGEYKLAVGGFKAFFKSKEMDSVRIRISADQIENLTETGWKTEFQISDKEVLSSEGAYYFLSRKDDTSPEFWNTSVLQFNGKELFSHAIGTTNTDLQKDVLKNYLQLNLLTRKDGKETVHQVAPGDVVLLKKLSALQEDRKDSVMYYTMNEAQLLRFIAKEMSSKNSIRFVKIKSIQ
jgi:hypothetical protein